MSNETAEETGNGTEASSVKPLELPLIMGVKTIAQQTGLSKSNVWNHIRCGNLKTVKIGNRTLPAMRCWNFPAIRRRSPPRSSARRRRSGRGDPMGHSKELLEMIAADVRRTYPEPEHRFVYEKGLKLTDFRNQPDIQIFRGATLVCVVEIGYTRPDKLKHYHEHEIGDIRWYDKKGRLQPLYVGNHGEVLKEKV
jgi:hypothetical protein